MSQVELRRASDGAATEHVTGKIRRRACCSGTDCPAPSWTIYEFGEYPSRGFDLQVVNLAISTVVFGKKTLSGVAATLGCSRRSLKRW
ncbi:hypothetical protein WDW86_13125, partial [Bdellovibrionota bacterium FG-2]